MKSSVLKRLLSYIGRYKGISVLAVLTGLISTIFTVTAPSILGNISTILYGGIVDGKWFKEDQVIFNVGSYELGRVGTIVWIMIVLAVVYLIAWIFAMVANKLFARLASRVVRDIRSDIDTKMHRIKLNYYDTRTNGEILSVITNDVDAINTLLSKNMYSVVTQVFTAIGVLIMMLRISGWLTLIAIAMVPATMLASGAIVKRSAKSFREQQQMLGDLNGYVEEMFDGQNVISSFNYQNRARARFSEINEGLQARAQRAEGFAGSVMPVTMGINNVGYALSGLFGCLMVLHGRLTIGNVQSILQYTKSFSQPFMTLAQMSSQLSTASAAGERVFALLDVEEEIPDPEHGRIPTIADGSVDFEHVAFGYLPDNLLMTDVSIHVSPGQKCAIVGPTGAGKTTLINLLMRFYEINDGRIVVDGEDTRKMTRHELRRHFGMVLQDTWLFEGTIRDNLKYSTNREVTDEEIEKAAASVCADSFIRTMPGGYDMVLSKGAENISQGQRQLLTIARAILADPEIMILDEATSNVDAHTEQVIQDAMATLMKGRTSFVIAHRLSTIRDADMILYMENGDIKEVGSHDELMKLGGKYAVLYNSQFEDQGA